MNARSTAVCGVFAASLTLTAAAPCHAGDEVPITVVAGARGALAHRLSQELEAAGLRVQVEASETAALPGALVVVIPEGDSGPIEIWSKSEGRSSLVASVGLDGTLDTRVLRAAELVRALIPAPHEGSSPPVRVPAEAPPPPSAPAQPRLAPIAPPPVAPTDQQHVPATRVSVSPPVPAPSKPALFDVGIAGALGVQVPGVSIALDASLRIWPHARVGAGFLAELPILAPEITAQAGSVRFRPAFFGAELVTAPIARTGRFGLVLSPGVALSHLSVSGDANPPYVNTGDQGFAFGLYGRVEARLQLVDSLHLTAGGLGGVVIPPVEIRFAGHSVSTFGAHASFSLGVLVQP